MLVGSVFIQDGALHNGIALLDKGKVAAIRFKHELPNYGVFDEPRVFSPGPLPEPIVFKGTMIGLPICEDVWGAEPAECIVETGGDQSPRLRTPFKNRAAFSASNLTRACPSKSDSTGSKQANRSSSVITSKASSVTH